MSKKFFSVYQIISPHNTNSIFVCNTFKMSRGGKVHNGLQKTSLKKKQIKLLTATCTKTLHFFRKQVIQVKIHSKFYPRYE